MGLSSFVRLVLGGTALLALTAVAVPGNRRRADVAHHIRDDDHPAPGSGTYDCGVTTYRVLFWPQGHQAVPGVGFTPYPIPHLELYQGSGATYPGSQFAVFIDSRGSGNVASLCTNATKPNSSPKRLQSVKKTTEAATITCKFSKKPIVEPFLAPGLTTLTLSEGTQRMLFAEIQATGSEVDYNKSACKAGPPPT